MWLIPERSYEDGLSLFSCQHTDGSSGSRWTAGVLPVFLSWLRGGREGAAQMISGPPSLLYTPDSCILIPTPYLTSCTHTYTRSLGAQIPFSHLGSVWENFFFFFCRFRVLGFQGEQRRVGATIKLRGFKPKHTHTHRKCLSDGFIVLALIQHI